MSFRILLCFFCLFVFAFFRFLVKLHNVRLFNHYIEFRILQWITTLSHTDMQLLTWGVGALVVLRTALVIVIVLLSVMVIPPVWVFTVCVVIIVCVPGVTVSVTGVGVMSAPFPSVGNWNTDVDWLGLWDREKRSEGWLVGSYRAVHTQTHR